MAIQERDAPATSRYFEPRRFGHANLYITDLDRSMDFYKNVVGLREAYRRTPIRAGFLNNGNTHHDIGMVEVTSPAARSHSTGLNHMAWELETQVDLVDGYRRAIAEGQAFDMTIDHEISHSLYLKDPDGNLNEIYADTKMRWWQDRAGDVRKPTFKWTPGEFPPDPDRNYEAEPEIVRVEAAVFHALKITGLCMVVDDYAGTYDFYTDFVGLRPMIGGRDSAYCALGGTCGIRDISLFRATAARPVQFHHMNFLCRDEADLEASLARARKEGVTIVAEIDRPTRRAVVVADPDGLRINFYVDRGTAAPDLKGVDEGEAIYLL